MSSASITKAGEMSVSSLLMRSGAVFDRREKYRYTLWREWDSGKPRVVFVMLNPSRADEGYNDQTIRTCIGFALANDFGSMEVVNLFAYRTSDPSVLRRTTNPVGCDNDRFINDACARSGATVLAWGNHGSLLDRSRDVVSNMMQRDIENLLCLGLTKQGQPRHPLYMKRATKLLPYRHGKERNA